MRAIVILSCLIFLMGFMVKSKAYPHELTGELSLDNRYFFNEGKDVKNQKDKYHPSLKLDPKYSHSFHQDQQVISVNPFYRYDANDDERTHFDMRELSWYGTFGDFAFRLGRSKVFWGVAESFHLVDVVNQTDYVESLDNEEKLGQLMGEISYSTYFGKFGLFVLPEFREKTMTGRKGRFRSSMPVAVDHPLYQSKDKDKHLDFAARYSHYYGAIDYGFSFFKGTDRNPVLTPIMYSMTDIKLQPYYRQTAQYGIDLQATHESLLVKFEGLTKRYERKVFKKAFVGGGEYTFNSLINDIDLGIISEYLYNKNDNDPFMPFTHHVFLGTRLFFNDIQSTEIVVGLFYDHKGKNSHMAKFEFSRRFFNHFKMTANGLWTQGVKSDDTLYFINKDCFFEVNVGYFF